MKPHPTQPNPIQPDSNERDELVRLLPGLVERDLPSDRQRRLQEFVMTRIHQDLRTVEQVSRPRPRRRFVLAASALAAVAVAAAAIGTGGFGVDRGAEATKAPRNTAGPASPVMVPVAGTFELAAAYAAARPFTPPRADQWVYVQNRNLAPSAMAADKGQEPDVTVAVWKRADGKKMAEFNPMTGKLDTWDQDNGYPMLSTLPTDPQALLALLREQMEAVPSAPPGAPKPPVVKGNRTPEELNSLLFDRVAGILGENLLPPEVTAALWRAAALVPGVTDAPETIEVDGRRVNVVGRVQEGWRFSQLMLDPDTHEFVGYRSVAVKDHTYETGPNGPVTEKKGQVQFTITRLTGKVVDTAGQTG
ncbi:CU044_5270 family protein [Micromonospora sp. NPDC050397]|uniref:CU044_5270 family protein n=1 Tax=Micromonospora sp. NPDC050397 TaxID=3364279 RepID=UPI00384F7F7D